MSALHDHETKRETERQPVGCREAYEFRHADNAQEGEHEVMFRLKEGLPRVGTRTETNAFTESRRYTSIDIDGRTATESLTNANDANRETEAASLTSLAPHKHTYA